MWKRKRYKFSYGKVKIERVEPSYQSQKMDWGIKLLNIPDSWKRTKGKGVKVAVLDTGICCEHNDLKANIKGGWNVVNGTRDFRDDDGHGSHCAGIIGAVDNNIGVIGVAPECDLYGVKVFGAKGVGDLRWLARGLEWCIRNEMDVINMSLGLQSDVGFLHNIIRKVYDAGIILISAAGNDIIGVDYPAKYLECVAVGAVDKNKRRAYFSSSGKEVFISAPGVECFSTYKNGQYAILSGTSMATPYVTGLAALAVAKFGKIGQEKLKQKIKETAIDIEAVGFDELTGWGLINPPKVARVKGMDIILVV